MKMKTVALATAVLFVSLSASAQSVEKEKSAPMTPQQVDQFDKAHQGLFSSQPDKAKEVGRFTETVAKSLPGGTATVGEIPRKNFVDEHILGRIERDGIPHAGLSSDEEFIRRVYLDATGLLPDSDAVRRFVMSTDPDKRDKLVDSLVGTEEFAEQWAWFWGDLFRLMSYSGNGKNAFQHWMKEWLQVDRPYNEVVADLLTPSAKSHNIVPHLAFFSRILRNSGLKNRDLTDPHNIAATTNRLDALDEMNIEIGRIFLGIQMDCISCHDGAGHVDTNNIYLGTRTRKEFAQQSAFLGRMQLVGIYNVNGSNLVLAEDPALEIHDRQ